MRKIFIACGYHGVKGATVETTERELHKAIKSVKSEMSKDMCRMLHSTLSKSLSEMLPDMISKGTAIDKYGEHYDREKFNDDLLAVGVYDHIGNNKRIGLSTNIQPGTDTLQ